MGKPLYHESEATEPIHTLHKVQDDNPKTDKGGHLFRTMSSLTLHQVSILPHSSSKEISLLSLLWVEKQSQLIQDLALWPIHLLQGLLKVTKPIPLLCQKMGITVFLYLNYALVLANSYTQAKKMGREWCSYCRDWV